MDDVTFIEDRIGNPIFALETNLHSLTRRLEPDNAETAQIMEDIQGNLETLKARLKEVTTHFFIKATTITLVVDSYAGTELQKHSETDFLAYVRESLEHSYYALLWSTSNQIEAYIKVNGLTYHVRFHQNSQESPTEVLEVY
jgi:hypothetical protein